MPSVYRKSFQASEKFGNGPSAKRARTADAFTRPRSQRNRKVLGRKEKNLSTTWLVTLWQLEAK